MVRDALPRLLRKWVSTAPKMSYYMYLILIGTSIKARQSKPQLLTTSSTTQTHKDISLPTTHLKMCNMECFGDQYRGCGHYVRIYQTGITYDCGRPNCKLSAAHMHKTAKNCGCNMEYSDHRRVRNLFQTKCDACLEYEGGYSGDHSPRSGRQW